MNSDKTTNLFSLLGLFLLDLLLLRLFHLLCLWRFGRFGSLLLDYLLNLLFLVSAEDFGEKTRRFRFDGTLLGGLVKVGVSKKKNVRLMVDAVITLSSALASSVVAGAAVSSTAGASAATS
jgi:hypothetical protein